MLRFSEIGIVFPHFLAGETQFKEFMNMTG